MRYAVGFAAGVAAIAGACSVFTSLDDLGTPDASCGACGADGGDAGAIEAGPGKDCTLTVSPTLAFVDAGSSAAIDVALTRIGSFTGPVVVALNGVPGVSANPITVGTDQDGGTLYIDVAANVPPEAVDLDVLSSNASCGVAIVTLAVPGVLDGGVFDTSGSFHVPTTTYLESLRFVLWGGGGGGNGGGGDGCSSGGSGGFGGYVLGDVDVSSGESLAITIGGGGATNGGGGGCTTVARGSTDLLVAPGGGGGGRAGYANNSNGYCNRYASGGSGGFAGLGGGNGQSVLTATGGRGGGPGGASAGGDGGATGGGTGLALAGGAGGTGTAGTGGAGGCGWFGGGGGGAATAVSPTRAAAVVVVAAGRS